MAKQPRWDKLEMEYVQDIGRSPITVEDMSEKYGISLSTLRKFATSNGWVKKRREYRQKVVNMANSKVSSRISDTHADIAVRHYAQSAKMMSMIEEWMNDPLAFFKYVEKVKRPVYLPDENGELQPSMLSEEVLICEVLDKPNVATVQSFVGALEKLQGMMRRTLGILDAKDLHKLLVDQQRLEHDMKRDDKDDNTDFSGLNSLTSAIMQSAELLQKQKEEVATTEEEKEK